MSIRKLVFGLTFVQVVPVLSWAQAGTVKITPLGSSTGNFCAEDRALLFEDPTRVRILFDPGDTIGGGDDSRLGAVDAILVSHAHADHLGNVKLAQDPDSPTAALCPGARVQKRRDAILEHGPDMEGFAIPGFDWQVAKEFDVGFALVLEVIEGVFGIGFAIAIEPHLGVVGLELGAVFLEGTIDAHAVAVAFGV